MKKKTLFSIVVGVALFILVLLGFAAYFGSLETAVAWVNGRSFSIEPRSVLLENCKPGAEEVVAFRLKNLTSQKISVVGEKSSCSCVFAENIPIAAGPKETVELKVRVRLPKYSSDYDQSIVFMVSTSKKLEMPMVRVVAHIPEPLPVPDDASETLAAPDSPPTPEINEDAEATGSAQDPQIPDSQGLENREDLL